MIRQPQATAATETAGRSVTVFLATSRKAPHFNAPLGSIFKGRFFLTMVEKFY